MAWKMLHSMWCLGGKWLDHVEMRAGGGMAIGGRSSGAREGREGQLSLAPLILCGS